MTITNIQELFDEIKDIENDMNRVVWKATDSVFNNVKEKAKKNTSQQGTGVLYRNIRKQVRLGEGLVYQSDDGMLVEWRGKKVNYAQFVHWGSRPHKIKPKNKRALRWNTAGGFTFSKEVNHPGYEGNAYFVDGLNEAEKEFKQWL